MGFLTTHVLDTAHGCPAQGVRIELRALDGAAGGRLLGTFTTDADGRTGGALLGEGAFAVGRYELLFHVGDYFAARGLALPSPGFLDVIPIRFGIADESAHYHVPLLVSPWSYSTYRGS